MNRYMIYMPAGTQGRLIPCHLDGSLTLGEMETLVDGFIDVLDSSLEPEWAREQVDGIRLVVGEDAKLFDAKRNVKPLGCISIRTVTRSWVTLFSVQRWTAI